jgi:O-antigen/teichoic acid export membrane protein
VVLSRAEHQPEQLDDITLRATLASTALVGVAALVALVLARPVLGMVGSAYQDEAVGLLQLMCLAAVPRCVVVMVAAWARGRQRIVLAVMVSIAEYIAMIGFALLFVGRMGVMGFGWAWLAGETLAAVVLAGVAWRTRHIDLASMRRIVSVRRVPNAAA